MASKSKEFKFYQIQNTVHPVSWDTASTMQSGNSAFDFAASFAIFKGRPSTKDGWIETDFGKFVATTKYGAPAVQEVRKSVMSDLLGC